jgi:hypothetical protein
MRINISQGFKDSIFQKGSFFFQFVPLSFFVSYAFWNGVPTSARWINAFEISSILGVLQLLLLLIFVRKNPINRLILSANIYLCVGGVACVFEYWEILSFYLKSMEAAILGCMLIVGLATTVFSSCGFIGINSSNKILIKKYSLILLGFTVLAFCMSLFFMGNRILAAVIPILLLSIVRHVLVCRLRKYHTEVPSSGVC